MNNQKKLENKLLILMLLLTQLCSAQTVSWDGGAATSNWTDALNWSTDAVPTGTDEVEIDGAIVDVSNTTVFIRSLSLLNNANLSIAGSGIMVFGGGTGYSLDINASTLINSGTINMASFAGGIAMTNPNTTLLNLGSIVMGDFTSYGLLVNSGCDPCLVENHGQLTFDDALGTNVNIIQLSATGGALDNYGTIFIGANSNQSGGIGTGFSGSTINNHGALNIYNTGSGRSAFMHNFIPGTLNNNVGAVVNLGAGLDGTAFVNNFNFNLVNNGTIDLDKAGAADVVVSGSGTFAGLEALSTINNITPGNSPGCMTFASGLTHSGSTTIELGGTTVCTQYDKINVSGTATISGAVSISLINGFTPVAGQSFTLLEADVISGTFSSISYPVVSGINWTVTYNATSVVVNAEPSLPVELLNFEAYPSGQSVDLQWTTASEINNKGFVIQRSTEAFDRWEDLGLVEGKGDREFESVYTFVDERPLSGVNYYRLKQIDFDGAFEYSRTVSADVKAFSKIDIYPNPAAASLHLHGDDLDGSTVRIIGAAGQQIYQAVFNGEQIDVQNLPSGMYLIEIVKNGQATFKRFVIERL